MRKILPGIIIYTLVISVVSCNSQTENNATKQAGDIQNMVKANSSGYIPTTAEYYLKAKINGKEWVAEEMMASDKAGRIVGQLKGDNSEMISLPFELRYTKDSALTNFTNNAVDIFTKGEVGIWGGRQGEMMFTKVGDNYAEGKFYVTAFDEATNKKLVITDGVFRIPLTEN